MERPSWKNWQLLQILQDSSLTPDELYEHTVMLLNSSSLLCFVHGNINQSQVGKSLTKKYSENSYNEGHLETSYFVSCREVVFLS